MHWVAPSEKDTASATLEKRLWDAADQFRANSGFKTQEYSAGSPQGPVLGLVFLRTCEYLTGEFAMSAGQGDWLKFDLLRGGARTIGRCDIMHELVHLVEGHHGPEFWQALGRAMPDWQKRKDALADKAKDYLVFGLRSGRAMIPR